MTLKAALAVSMILGSISASFSEEAIIDAGRLKGLLHETPILCLNPDGRGGCEIIVQVGSIKDSRGFEQITNAVMIKFGEYVISSMTLEFEIRDNVKCYTNFEQDIRKTQVSLADSVGYDRIMSSVPIELRDAFVASILKNARRLNALGEYCIFYSISSNVEGIDGLRRYEFVDDSLVEEKRKVEVYPRSALKLLYLIPEKLPV